MYKLFTAFFLICMVCGCKEGTKPGPINYDSAWHVGESVTVTLVPGGHDSIPIGYFSTNFADRIARFLHKYPMTHQKKKLSKYQSGYPAYLEWDRISDKLDTLTKAQYDSLMQYHIKAGDSASKMIFPEDSILRCDTIYRDTIFTPPHGGMAYPDPMQPLPKKDTISASFHDIVFLMQQNMELSERLDRLEERIDSLERRPVIYIDNLQKELWVKCPDGSCDIFIRKL